MKLRILAAFALASVMSVLWAQNPSTPNDDSQSVNQTAQPVNNGSGQFTYKVYVSGRSVPAIDYRHRSGATNVGLRGTVLAPKAKGDAKVNSHAGTLSVSTHVEHLQPATSFGPEYLTYVVWAITPEGRPVNIGELEIKGGRGSLNATTDLQSFGLIVTAEPYFAVTIPSDTVVLENYLLHKTKGVPEPITVRYQSFARGAYMRPVVNLPPPAPIEKDSRLPFDVYQARNAVRIARLAGAEQYAPESFRRAQELLNQTEDYASRKHLQRKVVTDVARHTAEQAEDARAIAVRARLAAEERQQREALKANADEARARADAEAQQRQAAEQAKADAQNEAQQAAQERQQAEQAQQQAEAARQAALDEQQRLAQQAAAADQQRQQAEQARQQAEQERQQAEQARQQAVQQQQELRSRLQQQLNEVMQTRNTARGLIVNMNDVLFDTGKADLKPGARERLARVAGILIAYPDLKVQVEGHTDSTGSQDFNQQLSERRADSVRDYLTSQGVKPNSITAQGYGPSMPVASNATAAGRQQNRRVELVVSGQSIGQPTVGANNSGAAVTGGEGQAGNTNTGNNNTNNNTATPNNNGLPNNNVGTPANTQSGPAMENQQQNQQQPQQNQQPENQLPQDNNNMHPQL